MESLSAVAAIYRQLAANAALVAALDPGNTGAVKIRHYQADPAWVPPYIVLNVLSSPGPSRIPGGDKVWSPVVITVALLTQGQGDVAINDLLTLIDGTLDRALFPAPVGTVVLCLRKGDRQFAENDDGKTYIHSELDYELLITPA